MTDTKPDAAALLLEIREELFRLGQDSSCAYEHGDIVSMRKAERAAKEIHDRIDGFLAAPPTSNTNDLPAIGQPFGGGIYAGLSLEDNKPVALVLLPGEAEEITWNKALIWAEEQGGVLPSRIDALQLFLRLKVEFKEAVYWTADQHAGHESYAWFQDFDWGGQDGWLKGGELRARAVRRMPLKVEEAPPADSVSVPREPTKAMMEAAFMDYIDSEKNKRPWNARTMWKAMLLAASKSVSKP